MTVLYVIGYAIIGLILGRVWYVACHRRGEPVLAAMGAAFGIFWPMMLVIVPVVFLVVLAIERFVAPAVRWAFKRLDSAVARVVPKKAD